MLTRLVASTRAPLLLAVVTLVVPVAVLARYGMFRDYSADEGSAVAWGTGAWLVAPYVALAALLVRAARSGSAAFRIAVDVTSVAVVVQSVLLDVLTLGSDEALAAVGLLIMPVLHLGGAVVLAAGGLVLQRLERAHRPTGASNLTLTSALPPSR